MLCGCSALPKMAVPGTWVLPPPRWLRHVGASCAVRASQPRDPEIDHDARAAKERDPRLGWVMQNRAAGGEPLSILRGEQTFFPGKLGVEAVAAGLLHGSRRVRGAAGPAVSEL